jgi:hypothetical protein
MRSSPLWRRARRLRARRSEAKIRRGEVRRRQAEGGQAGALRAIKTAIESKALRCSAAGDLSCGRVGSFWPWPRETTTPSLRSRGRECDRHSGAALTRSNPDGRARAALAGMKVGNLNAGSSAAFHCGLRRARPESLSCPPKPFRLPSRVPGPRTSAGGRSTGSISRSPPVRTAREGRRPCAWSQGCWRRRRHPHLRDRITRIRRHPLVDRGEVGQAPGRCICRNPSRPIRQMDRKSGRLA